jgi:hypothetical protein
VCHALSPFSTTNANIKVIFIYFLICGCGWSGCRIGRKFTYLPSYRHDRKSREDYVVTIHPLRPHETQLSTKQLELVSALAGPDALRLTIHDQQLSRKKYRFALLSLCGRILARKEEYNRPFSPINAAARSPLYHSPPTQNQRKQVL